MKMSKMHQRVLSRAPYQRVITDNVGARGVPTEGHYGRYGWEGPNKADKGHRLGSCNVTRCQRPGAYWYNKGTDAWYCTSCAHGINYAPLPDGSYLCSPDAAARDEHFAKLEAE